MKEIGAANQKENHDDEFKTVCTTETAHLAAANPLLGAAMDPFKVRRIYNRLL